ncbi:MAG: hypothetical protein HQK65_23205 [Desulfamplus sp.]|nr:hypothetical protein [Desulfamplus sp.]
MQAQPVKINGHLLESAKIAAQIQSRSMSKQIEHWAKIGKIAEENPDLPFNVIRDLLQGMAEIEAGQEFDYETGQAT